MEVSFWFVRLLCPLPLLKNVVPCCSTERNLHLSSSGSIFFLSTLVQLSLCECLLPSTTSKLCGTELMIVRQSERSLFVADVTTLCGVKTEMSVLEHIPHGFWRLLVAFAADHVAPSLCVVTTLCNYISYICMRVCVSPSTVFALYNRNRTFMVFLALLVVAQYASSAILGSSFASDIAVVDGVCVSGGKLVLIM